MEKRDLIYEGKAKKVYTTTDETLCIVSYKDDTTAFNSLIKSTIVGRGIVNNKVSNLLMQILEKQGIPTHYVEELNERETLVKRVAIIPLEVVVRNTAAGSFAKRYDVLEGTPFDEPTVEFSYKNDDLGDPLMCECHALALKLATEDEIEKMKEMAFIVNDTLKAYFKELNIDLIDFKLEFGRLPDGTVILADEISPDTCRLWDSDTKEKLDKDRFRKDLEGVEEAYQEIMQRLLGK